MDRRAKDCLVLIKRHLIFLNMVSLVRHDQEAKNSIIGFKKILVEVTPCEISPLAVGLLVPKKTIDAESSATG